MTVKKKLKVPKGPLNRQNKQVQEGNVVEL